MIFRIFNVSIKEHYLEEFEQEFNKIAEHMKKSCKGLISCQIGYPCKFTPCDYSLIMIWQDEDSLEDFAGKDWNHAIIPEHMQKYPNSYSVQHYELKNSEFSSFK